MAGSTMATIPPIRKSPVSNRTTKKATVKCMVAKEKDLAIKIP